MDQDKHTPVNFSEILTTNHKTSPFMLGVVVLIFVLGIFSLISTPVKPEVPAGVPVVKVDPTDGWKTYKNEKYGFEIKYPKDLITSSATSSYPFPNNGVNLELTDTYYIKPLSAHWSFQISSFNTTAVQCAKNSPGGEITNSLVKVVINALDWYKSVGGDCGMGHCVYITRHNTFQNDTCYSFDSIKYSSNPGGSNGRDDPQYDLVAKNNDTNSFTIQSLGEQILSTVKFTDLPIYSVADYSKPFQQGRDSYWGTLTLTGYLSTRDVKSCPNDEESICPNPIIHKYASFNFLESDNDLIYTYLNEESGNSYVRKQSVGLGCYDPDKKVISSLNSGDDGEVTNRIIGQDLDVLASSSDSNLVKLQMTKPYYSYGRDAPICYSHFRNFKIVK